MPDRRAAFLVRRGENPPAAQTVQDLALQDGTLVSRSRACLAWSANSR
jgi:hypothetical protein